jgi:hypothetical protein
MCVFNPRQDPLGSKEGSSTASADASAIQAVASSDIYSWPEPDAHLTGRSERTEIENKWFALTGCAVTLEVETHGDRHVALRPHPHVALLLRISYQRFNHCSS